MTIDEAKKIIHDFLNNPNGVPVCGLDDAIKIALSTVEKYQEIAKIIRNYDVAWEFHTMRDTIDKIREVVADGNDD